MMTVKAECVVWCQGRYLTTPRYMMTIREECVTWCQGRYLTTPMVECIVWCGVRDGT